MVGELSSNYKQPLKQLANFVQQTDGSICLQVLDFFWSKTNCLRKRPARVSDIRWTVHPQSENEQDQHLRDIGGMSREAFDNPNSFLLCDHYVGGSDDGVCCYCCYHVRSRLRRGPISPFRGYKDREISWSPKAEWIYLWPTYMAILTDTSPNWEGDFPTSDLWSSDDIFEW